MNILVIDDQPDVVKGILSGVRWTQLGILKQFQAYDIFQAKEILIHEKIQILLCDIEMPMGSGLELYEWALQHFPYIKCIFLTSHAEFSYAQKVLQLGGFDYMLQPARYLDIEQVLQRAIVTIEKEQLEKKYYQYGLYVSNKEQEILQGILVDYFRNIQTDSEKTAAHLKEFSVDVSDDSLCLCVMVNIMSWKTGFEEMANDLLSFILRNILLEIFESYTDRMLTFFIDVKDFVVFLYGETVYDMDKINAFFEKFMEFAEKYFNCACYISRETTFAKVPTVIKELTTYKDNNVTNQTGVLPSIGKIHPDRSYDPPELTRWIDRLNQGYYSIVKKEIYDYLKKHQQAGRLNLQFLANFHQDFIQMFFEVINKYQLRAHEVFEQEYDYNVLMKSYISLEKMLDLVDFCINYIEYKATKNEVSLSQIEKAESFIQQNIHRNISRADIAEHVYLNPEYLSRLFKKEKGIPLSDFIVQEKMKIAAALLQDTDYPIAMIASKVGYSNFSNFAQVFRKIYGVSPSNYRK